eukprot:5630_1
MASRKLALVTGANKGIGYAICKQLLQTQSFNVLLASRNIDRGKQALDQLKRDIPDLDPTSVDLLPLDVSNESSIQESLDFVQKEKQYSKLDVLINNAGIASGDEFNAALAKRVLATNFYGAINCTSAFLPLINASDNGRILMMSSRVGAITKLTNNPEAKEQLNSDELQLDGLYEIMNQFIADMDKMEQDGLSDEHGNLTKDDVKAWGWWNSAYGMSKLGLSAYTRILARNAPSLFVGAYCPGFVATDMTSAYGKKIPLGPDDGARGMVLLANPEKRDAYETGKFWALNNSDDEDVSAVEWYNCRIPRKRKQ